MNRTFVEVDSFQVSKNGQSAAGDSFLSRKNKSRKRVLAVLSDGLGSGIKAGVLSTLTATMALKAMEKQLPVRHIAEVISRTLPVCSERKISYSTFTLLDIDPRGKTRLIEYDNPSALFLREGKVIPVQRDFMNFDHGGGTRRTRMSSCEFQARPGDRIVFFSDGVTQSGMGTGRFPLGWGDAAVSGYLEGLLEDNPFLSARKLARQVVRKSLLNDVGQARDDISCGVIYFRKPRRLILASGPPLDPRRDEELARRIEAFPGTKIVSGGTTAGIVSRQLGKTVRVNLKNLDPLLPPSSEMEGIDLVTEGILTLGRVAEWLESREDFSRIDTENPAGRIVESFMESDDITLLAGTKINEAHQDPNMPVELEIRRNIIKKIAHLLQHEYLKDVHLEFI